ncbi:hypothetical protein PRIPAC_73271, partial [Pristionchus pacificus]|uniref:Uncharacterized protein n=1 Tax=Pristionchus pacificus TaxID=54126 RepID=A0A2A6CRY5_PRIPA
AIVWLQPEPLITSYQRRAFWWWDDGCSSYSSPHEGYCSPPERASERPASEGGGETRNERRRERGGEEEATGCCGRRDVLTLSLVSLLSLSDCRVTFDKADLLDHSDLQYSTTAPFSCPKGCSVYSPSRTTSIKPGNYLLKNTDFYAAEFTFYVVQKDAVNFDVPVYTTGGKVGVSNQRYVTFLTDMPGFRIKDINGDLSNDAVQVYTTGAQGLGTAHCKPVFTSRSADNAARSTLNILGPIATIDFGSSKSMHYATFVGDYSTIYTDVGTSSIYVSPGYVGCGGTQLYANDYITKIQKQFKAQKSGGMCVQVYADYAISSVTSALSISVNKENLTLTDTGVLSKRYDGTNFDISLLWNKQGDRDSTQFAAQIDLLAKADCAAKG